MFEDTLLYEGEITLRFDTVKHQYRVIKDGRTFKVPSVTTICGVINKPALVNWAINSTLDVCKGAIAPGVEYAEAYLEAVWQAAKDASATLKRDAAKRGTARHKELELQFKEGVGLSDESWPETSRRWLESLRFEAIERRIFSRRYRYSGTCDGIARIDGQLILIDWKTGKNIYPEYRLQTAAYVAAYEEEFPSQKIEGRYLVRIGEDGSIEPHYFPRSTLRKDFAAFLGAKALFDRVQQIEREARKALKTKQI